jgi:hypothetical protein
LARITAWLAGHGFAVEEIAASGRLVVFSGNAGMVADTFHTEIHRYVVNGVEHIGNAQDPQIPAALAGVVGGVVSLHDFRRTSEIGARTELSSGPGARPQYSSGSTHYLFPADSSTLTLTASSSAIVGSATITVTASGDGISASKQISVQVTQAPGVELALSAKSLSMVHTGTGAITLTVTALGGLSPVGSFTLSGLPAGINVTMTNVNVTASGSMSLTLTILGSAAARAGSSTVTITVTCSGNSGSYSAAQQLSLALN